MANPLSIYRIFKKVIVLEHNNRKYHKFHKYVRTLPENKAYSLREYINYHEDAFNRIYHNMYYIYQAQDFGLFMYIKELVHSFCSKYANISDANRIARRFGFMCNAPDEEYDFQKCDKKCDNYICTYHIILYNNTKLLIQSYLEFLTSLQINDVNHIIFQYYFHYNLYD